MKIDFAIMKVNFSIMKIDFVIMKINFAKMEINFDTYIYLYHELFLIQLIVYFNIRDLSRSIVFKRAKLLQSQKRERKNKKIQLI